MIDIFDPVLKSSNIYKKRRNYIVKKPLTYIAFLLVLLVILFFVFTTSRSTLDTKPRETIHIDPGLKTTPGSDSPTGRIPTIPKTPTPASHI